MSFPFGNGLCAIYVRGTCRHYHKAGRQPIAVAASPAASSVLSVDTSLACVQTASNSMSSLPTFDLVPYRRECSLGSLVCYAEVFIARPRLFPTVFVRIFALAEWRDVILFFAGCAGKLLQCHTARKMQNLSLLIVHAESRRM